MLIKKIFLRNQVNRKTDSDTNPEMSYCGSQTNLTEQMLNLGLLSMTKKPENKLTPLESITFPEYFDVREKFGKICPGIKRVYNQGQCKSGWVGNLCFV